MGEILLIVALGKIAALMGAARFLAIERAMHNGLGDVEHEAEFERLRELGIEGARVVVASRCSATRSLQFANLLAESTSVARSR